MSMNPTAPLFNHIVAFEVSKAELVVHTLPADRQERIPNTAARVRRILLREQRANTRLGSGPMLVLCEATGGYEHHVLEQAHELNLNLHRAHGSSTRLFARLVGHKAKTDQIDAAMLAHYGRTQSLALYHPPSPHQQALRALRRRHDDMTTMLRMELNRTEQARSAAIKTSLHRHCRWLQTERDALQAQIDTLIAQSAELEGKASLIQSIKGVGPKTAAAVLAYLPEIGTITKAQAAGLAGLAPYANDSGSAQGKRHIAGGRSPLRASLYMAALVARYRNPKLRAFGLNLKARGKPNKLVLTAIMRKLIVIINAVIASGQPART